MLLTRSAAVNFGTGFWHLGVQVLNRTKRSRKTMRPSNPDGGGINREQAQNWIRDQRDLE